ncbi:MAG: thioredoxin-dependent thiol peroxidase [Myroides sp.]|nr:thioredoxin-dependent thiol peroxidase [uncultured Flavobacterium sp.]MBS7321332.1 thioredoxin-dependent thiol peroxidase [Myroides sp.]
MTTLKAGDKAPDFTGTNQNGETVNLKDFKGKKVVLFFYPKASTPGCTAQACDLQNNLNRFVADNYQIIGVSADSQQRQLNFAVKNNIQYPLLADEDKTIIEAYGVWGAKKFMGREYDGIHRTTFLINEQGVITEVISKVKTKVHTEQILK